MFKPQRPVELPSTVRITPEAGQYYVQYWDDKANRWKHIKRVSGEGFYRNKHLKNAVNRARLAYYLQQSHPEFTYDNAYRAIMTYALTYDMIDNGQIGGASRWANAHPKSGPNLRIAIKPTVVKGNVISKGVETLDETNAFWTRSRNEEQSLDELAKWEAPTPVETPTDEDILEPISVTAAQAQAEIEDAAELTCSWLEELLKDFDEKDLNEYEVQTAEAAQDALMALRWILEPEERTIVVKKNPYERRR